MRLPAAAAAGVSSLPCLAGALALKAFGSDARWQGNLAFLLLCLAAGLIATSAWEGPAGRRLKAWAESRPAAFWGRLVTAGACAFAAVFSLTSVLRWAALSPVMWDLGNFDQPLWNVVHGHGLEVTQHHFDGNLDRMSSHFEPILYLFAVPYLFAPSPLWILILQALILGASAPVLHRAFAGLLPPPSAALLALLFLLLPSLHFAAIGDFHADSPAVFFLSLAFLALQERRMALYAAAVLGALLCKEYAALVTACLGLYALAARRQALAGALTMAVSAAWFYVVMEFVMPHFNRGQPPGVLVLNYADLGAGGGLPGMARHLLLHPGDALARAFTPVNVENLIYLLGPLLCLPLLAPAELAVAVPIFAKDLLADFNLGNHHLSMSLPFLFLAMARGLSRPGRGSHALRARLLPALTGSLLLGTLLLSPAPVGQRFWRTLADYVPSARDADAKALLARIPADAPVSASPHLAPRLTHRRHCFLFPAPHDKANADYIAVDFGPELPDAGWTSIEEARDSLEALKRDPRFEVLANRGDMWLFRRKAAAPAGLAPADAEVVE